MNFDNEAFELIRYIYYSCLSSGKPRNSWSLKEKRCQQHGKDESEKNLAKIRTLTV